MYIFYILNQKGS